MSEAEVLTEVPHNLKQLVRIIMRSFYGDEHAIVMDKLIHHPCIKEDELLELLRFERKQLRAIMTTLKNEKFVRVRIRMETEADGTRTTRHNYYFISYSVFVNVVKYKLDHMRRKIETDERDATSRASFSCPECHKTYTDLEVDKLLDFMSGLMLCTYCQSEVTEETVSKPRSNDSRSLMVMFNEQIEPIYALLKKVEDLRLSNEILEPEPSEYKATKSSTSRADGKQANGAWSTNESNVSFGYTENKITISMDGRNAAVGSSTRPAKEVPQWIAQSTVDGAEKLDVPQPSSVSRQPVASNLDTDREMESDDIMRTLLSHEKKPSTAVLVPPVNENSSSSESDEDFDSSSKPSLWQTAASAKAVSSEADLMETDDDDDEQAFIVTIGDTRVPVFEVSEEMVARMTPVEKTEYIRLCQEYHEQYH